MATLRYQVKMRSDAGQPVHFAFESIRAQIPNGGFISVTVLLPRV